MRKAKPINPGLMFVDGEVTFKVNGCLAGGNLHIYVPKVIRKQIPAYFSLELNLDMFVPRKKLENQGAPIGPRPKA